MSDLPIRQKKPGEARTITFDFTTKLSVGDTLTGTPLMAVTPTGGGALTAGSPALSGNEVNVRLSNGVDATDYTVKCSCATSNGDTLHLSVLVEVREGAN